MTRQIRFLLGLAALVALGLHAGAHAQPTVTSVSPPAGDPDAAPSTDVAATFSETMNAAHAATFIVRGSMTGERAGTYGGGGTATLSFDPAADFWPDERVSVTLSTGLQSAGGTPLGTPYGWDFVAATQPTTGVFSIEQTVDGSFDGARSVYTADVGGDGDLDMLGAAVEADAITWWENTAGDGSAWVEHAVDGAFDHAWSVYAADLDGDGDLDVLGAAELANDIAWWVNSVVPEVTATIPVASEPAAEVSTDVSVTFNEAMNVADAASFIVRGSMTGDRAGTYGGGGTTALSFDPVVDFLPGERVTVTLTSALTSTSGVPVSAPYAWEFLAAAEAAPGTFPGEITVDGAFDGAESVYAADVDGDGDLDVLGAAFFADGITWWENTAGDGSAWTEHTVDGAFDRACDVHAADVDGDGDLDVLGAARLADAVTWWENTAGDGTAWTEHTVDGTFDMARSVYEADVDGDGDMDVLGAAMAADDIAWWVNGTAPEVTATIPVANEPATAVSTDVSADFTQSMNAADAASFIVRGSMTGERAGTYGGGGTSTLSFDAAVGFLPGERVTVTLTSGLTDMGGVPLNAPYTWEFVAATGEAAGVFAVEETVDGAFDGAMSVYVADVDGDLDVLGAAYAGDAIAWWENSAGDGSAWTEHSVDGDFLGAYGVYAADVDGDGDLDVLGAAATANTIAWWPNTAERTVSAPTVTATHNEQLTIPISIDAASGIRAAEVFIEYDTNLLAVFSAPSSPTSSVGTLTEDWAVETNTEAGAGSLETLKIAMATDESSVSGPQTLINVLFTVNDVRVPASSPLTLTHVVLNNGTPPSTAVDGLVTLVGDDGSLTSVPEQFIPRETITVTVVDLDADLDGVAGTDQVSVTARNTTTGDQVAMTLDEDGVAAGTFVGTVDTEFGTAAIADGLIQAQAGEVVVFTFVDALDGAGVGPTDRTDQSEALDGNDGSIAITLVSQPGDPLYIQVTDPDLNTSFSSAQTASVVVTNSRTAESFTVTLTEVDVDDEVFFGSLATTAGASTATEMSTAEEDIVTATYDDVVTAICDQVDRVADDDVIDPWGDADDNEQTQAFDASEVLLDVLGGGTLLSDLGRRSANVDLTPVTTGINPYDASLILQKRVGLITDFPVQDPASENHPQGTPGTPKELPQMETRYLALRAGDGYLSVWADDRSGLLSGDLSIAGISGRVKMHPELSQFLVASRPVEDGLQVVFAGAEAVAGPGELLRVHSPTISSQARLTRAEFNNGTVQGQVDDWAAVVVPGSFALHPNAPNPFNPETVIRFDLPQASHVQLVVYDAVGQKVRTLLAEERPAGTQLARWDARGEAGSPVSSGVYFYRIQAGAFVQMHRMLLLK